MRVARFLLIPLLSVSLLLPIAAQQSLTVMAPRDAQATTLLQQSIAAMGTTIPSDSTASGTVTLVEGSLPTSGTIRILTHGTGQTNEQVQTTARTWSVVYSSGQASRTEANTTTALSLERAASSQSVYFPLPFVSGLLSNPDVAIRYIGPETLNGVGVQHVRATNTFNSSLSLQFLSAFTVTDIWLDGSTNLPTSVSFVRRDGGGATPKILVAVSYSNFQTTNGLTYPQQIQESINGTVWATIALQSITLNTGLTDSDFSIQ
jgi:hypothetical protein